MKDTLESLKIIEHDSYDDAIRSAATDAAASMATVAPGIIYRQGGR